MSIVIRGDAALYNRLHFRPPNERNRFSSYVDTASMSDSKITVILAGGDMEIRHYLTLWAAVGEYPDDALIVAGTPEEVEGILSESPISKDEFLTVTGRLVRHHGSGGFLQ